MLYGKFGNRTPINKPYFDTPRAKIAHNPFTDYWQWAVLNPANHVWEWRRKTSPNEVIEWFMSNDDYTVKYGLPVSDLEQYKEEKGE